MEQVISYADVVRTAVGRLGKLLNKIPKPGVETLLLEEDGHFLLKRVGWHAGERVNNTVVFLRLKSDKVWIEEDWTEDGIATELLRAGVPREDIVLAFHPPHLRHLTEFATA